MHPSSHQMCPGKYAGLTQRALGSKGASGQRDLCREVSAPQNGRGDRMALSTSHNRRLFCMGTCNPTFIHLRAVPLFFLILMLAAFVPNSLHSQNATSGGLTGVVTDPSDALVPYANVELKDNAKGITQTKSTNSVGEYSFSFVAPSNYTLTVTHPGFRIASQTFDVTLGPPVTVNVRLEIAGAHITVNVTDVATLLHAENGDASSTMSQLQVAQVPNPGSDLTYIAQTSPGAIMNTDTFDTAFSILGMPGTSTLFTLNGMSYTDLGGGGNMSGATNLLLGVNAVQEATVVSNGYSGRFGTMAGAEVNYVTKSGGDEFHGNASYFWNGSALNANDWINNATGTKRPRDNANQWAGSIGGPIRKRKVFFFFDTEGLDLIVPHTQQVVLPSAPFESATIANIDSIFGPNSASDAFFKQIFSLYNNAPGASKALPGSFSDPLGCTQHFTGPNGLGTAVPCAVHYQTTLGRPSYESLLSGRVDWHIRPEDNVFLSIAYSRGHQSSYTDPISSLFNLNSNQPWWQGQLVETHSFGQSGVNQLVAAGWQIRAFFALDDPSQALAALPTQLNWYVADTFASVGTSLAMRSGSSTTQYQISDDVVKTWGDHKLGFGASLLRHDLSNLNSTDGGTVAPFTLDAFYQGGFDPATGDTTVLEQSFASQLEQHISNYVLGFYVQDEWHTRPNLTVTLALRNEHQSNPVCQNNCFARLAGSFASVSHDPEQPYNQAILINRKQGYDGLSNLLWAPRASFAWQPFGVSHNFVLRGGLGFFYNVLPTAAAQMMDTNPPLVNPFYPEQDNIAPDETTSLFKDAANSNAAFLSGFAAGETLSEIEEQAPVFSPPGFVNPDRFLKSPQYQKWSLEVQQAFGANTSINVGYFGNHGIHELIQNVSANAYGYGTLPAGLCTSPPVAPCADARFSGMNELTTAGVSNYNGLVLSFEHRFTGWMEGVVQANYTLGHAFDESSNGGLYQFTSGSVLSPQDPNNIRGSYGQAEYDVRHSMNANYVWQLPVSSALRHRGPAALVKGWQVSGTIFARTGFPYTIFDLEQEFALQGQNLFGPIYSVPAGPLKTGKRCGEGAAIPLAPHPCQPAQVLSDGSPNPEASFVQTYCETGFNTGTLPGPSGPCGGATSSIAQGRNRFRGPSYFDTDFGLMKNTKVPGWEKGQLGIGFQFFNFFNHPNFGFPDNLSSDQSFGQIFYMESPPTGILGSALGGDASPRNIQLKVQLQF